MHRFFNTSSKKKFIDRAYSISLTLASINIGLLAYFSLFALQVKSYNQFFKTAAQDGMSDANDGSSYNLEEDYTPEKVKLKNAYLSNLTIAFAFSLSSLLLGYTLKPRRHANEEHRLELLWISAASLLSGIGLGAISYILPPFHRHDNPESQGYYYGYQSQCQPQGDSHCIGGIDDPYAYQITSPSKLPIIITGITLPITLLAISLAYVSRRKITQPNDQEMQSLTSHHQPVRELLREIQPPRL